MHLKRHNCISTLTTLLLSASLTAATIDLTTYKKATDSELSKANLATNGSFDDGPYQQPGDTKHAQIARGFGLVYSNGLKMMPDTSRRSWSYGFKVPQRLQPGKIYRYSADVRIEGEAGGNLCFEAYDKSGKWAYGDYRSSHEGNNPHEWHKVSGQFKTRGENTAEYTYYITTITHTSNAQKPGVIYYDNFRLEEDKPTWTIANAFPLRNRIYADRGLVRFHTKFQGQFMLTDADEAYLVELLLNGKTVASQLAQRQHEGLEVRFGKLPTGPATLKVTLLDRKNKKIMGTQTMPVTVTPRFQPPKNGWDMDEYGRCILNGKPFMPLGFYGKFSAKPQDRPQVLKDLKMIQKTGLFNFLQDYGQYLHGSLTRRCAWIRECHDHGLWSSVDVAGYSFKPLKPEDITGLKKSVTAYRDIPGTFCYYLSDEPPESRVPRLAKIRGIVNELDPGHPTWIVNVYGGNVAGFIPAADLIVYDSYPIQPNGTLRPTDNCGIVYRQAKLPHWAVTQSFNLNIYQGATQKISPEHYAASEPTPQQMLANVLNMAINGSKAFIFYSFFDLRRGRNGQPASEELFQKRWQDVCQVAAQLKQLEPFIMSGQDELTLTIQNTKGKLNATCLTDGKGDYRLLVVGVDKDNEGIITLPSQLPQLTSTDGTLTYLGKGQYKFSGKSFSYAIAR